MRRLGGCSLLMLVGLLVCTEAKAAKPCDAFTYKEWSADGSYVDKARELATSGGVHYGIDEYSRVEILVDTEKLRRALSELNKSPHASPEVVALGQQVAALEVATGHLTGALEASQAIVRLHSDRPKTQDFAALDAALTQRSTQMLGIKQALKDAILVRLARNNLTGEDASNAADEEMDDILDPKSPSFQFAYNWDRLGGHLRRELAEVEIQIDRLQTSGLRLDIRAHAVRPGVEAYPLSLDHYNEEATGPQRAVQRHHFEASAQEKKLFDDYTKMAANIGDSKSVADAMLKGLQAQVPEITDDAKKLAQGVQSALEANQTSLQTLTTWGKGRKFQDWFAGVKQDVTALPEVSGALNELQEIIAECVSDLETLEGVAHIAEQIGSGHSAGDLATLLSLLPTEKTSVEQVLDPKRWADRLERAKAALAKIESAAPAIKARLQKSPGPVADFESARDALTKTRDVIAAAPVRAKTWLISLGIVPVANTAVSLPTPQGQKQLSLDDDLNTAFDLRTVRQGIHGDEAVLVSVAVVDESDKDVYHFQDEFRLGTYGWSSRVSAALAFARQIRDERDPWKTTASMSWIAHHRNWPNARKKETGLKQGPGFGMGLSFLALDFDSQESTEIGVAPMVAAFGDRIQLGAGYDLQARKDAWFAFFAIRLVQIPGVLGTQPSP